LALSPRARDDDPEVPEMRATLTIAAVALLLLGLAACDSEITPVGPSTIQPSASSATPQSIAFSGSTWLKQPGEASQLTVLVTFSDGTTRDMTAQTACYVVPYSHSYTPHMVVRFSSRTGCSFTAAAFGSQEIEIAYPPPSWWPAPPTTATARATVRVVPDGAFVLRGRVTEAGYPLEGARVELTSPSGNLSSVADYFGNYMLAPVSGDVQVTATIQGYAAVVRQMRIDHDQQMDLQLQPAVEPRDIRGVYTLTFTASPFCSLPAHARRRQYAARLVEGRDIGRPEPLIVILAGAEFVVFGTDPGFTGTRDGNTLRFTISVNARNDYSLVELIDLKEELYYDGTISVTVGQRNLVGPFNGRLSLVDRFSQATLGTCQATDHKVEFVR
jgi:hypothetical protein